MRIYRKTPLFVTAIIIFWLVVFFFVSVSGISAEEKGACVGKDQVGRTVIRAACINLEKGIVPGLKTADLGAVAVAAFEIRTRPKETSSGNAPELITFPDNQDVTGSFTRPLISANIPLVERNHKEISRLLTEHKFSVSGLVEGKNAPSLGKFLGAKTLIVGIYEVQGEFPETRKDGSGNLVIGKPKSLQSQSVHIRGLDMESGRIVFDVKASLSGQVISYPAPRRLAGFAGNTLIRELGKVK